MCIVFKANFRISSRLLPVRTETPRVMPLLFACLIIKDNAVRRLSVCLLGKAAPSVLH